MRSSSFVLLLLAACLLGAGSAMELLDPSDWIGELSAPGLGVEKWRKPDFCGKMECPPFRTRKHTDNYDVRKYEAGKWLVTNVTDTKYELAYMKGTARLLKYFKGSNDQEEHFDVTTPTLAELKLAKSADEETERDYAFSLWLPKEAQKDTPQPTDADVKVIEYPSITVYARVFSGFATEGTILEETRSLHEILKDEERDFEDQLVWSATYDPPQKLLKRHNEIHVPFAAKKA